MLCRACHVLSAHLTDNDRKSRRHRPTQDLLDTGTDLLITEPETARTRLRLHTTATDHVPRALHALPDRVTPSWHRLTCPALTDLAQSSASSRVLSAATHHPRTRLPCDDVRRPARPRLP